MRVRLAIVVLLCVAVVGCRGLAPFGWLRHERDVNEVRKDLDLDVGQLLIRSNFVVPDRKRLAHELTAEGDDICQTLGLPCSTRPITVNLFRDARSYSERLARDFPKRARARVFVENNDELEVYAHWSERVAEDLRHEVAHGYLHSILSGLPLWLDEGLAEYFEVAPGRGGLNSPHLDLLSDLIAHNRWRPNLERLERLDDIAQMDQQSYAEAWAWVYFMLNSQPQRREVLTQYLLDLSAHRGNAEPIALQLAKQDADPEQSLVDFLAGLQR